MNLFKNYNEIIKNPKFKEIKELELRTIFFSKSKNQEINWNYTFFKNHDLHTFKVENDKVIYIGKDKEFNDKIKFNILDIKKIKSQYEDIDKIAKELINDSNINNEICTISDNDEFGLHWNLTKITSTMDMINIKISDDKKILKHTKESLLKLGKWEKGLKK